MENTKNRDSRAIILFVIAALSLLFFLFALVGYLYGPVILLALLIFVAFSRAGVLAMTKQNTEKAPLLMRRLMIFYLATFLFIFLWLTVLNRGIVISSPGVHQEHRVNFVPFRTIREMSGLTREFGRNFVIINLLGNAVCLVPTAFFYPVLWKRAGNPIIYFLLVSATCIAAEVLQFVFYSGATDIDDYILNVGGAMVFFFIFRLRPVRKFFDRIFPYLGIAEGSSP